MKTGGLLMLIAFCGCATSCRNAYHETVSSASIWHVETILPPRSDKDQALDSSAETNAQAGHPGIRALDFSADGTLLATADLDGHVCIYDTESWRKKRYLNYKGTCYGVQFAPGGRLLLTFGDADAQIWDVASGSLIDRINCLFTARFIHGGKQVLVDGYWTGDSRPTLYVGPSNFVCWDVQHRRIVPAPVRYAFYWDEESKCVTNMPAIRQEGDWFYYMADQLDNGSIDARYTLHKVQEGPAADKYVVQMWDQSGPSLIQTMKKTYTEKEEPVSAWLGADGTKVFVVDRKQQQTAMTVFDRMTGDSLLSYPLHCDWGETVLASPDSRLLAEAANLRSETNDVRHGLAVIVDAESGTVVARLDGHPGGIYALTWTPTGTRFATGGEDGRVIVWKKSQQGGGGIGLPPPHH